jgi:hypothetical protein
MKRIVNYLANAAKISGNGTIRYCLWVDDTGNLYVQFEENEVNTNSPGTFTGLLFSVADYASVRNSNSDIGHVTGIDADSDTKIIASGNNNGAFLKAVLRHLLP